MKKVIVIGSGGHAKVVIDIILKRQQELKDELQIDGILDDNYLEGEEKDLFGIPILGKIDKILELPSDIFYIIAIGNNEIRKEISEKYNLNYITLIHPKTIIGNNVIIEEGTVIMAGVIINSYTKIGKHCILNTGSIIEHDNLIGNYVHISPNTTLCGGVNVGELSWIGSGTTVIQQIKIGEKVVVGAGSLVIKKISEGSLVFGSPITTNS